MESVKLDLNSAFEMSKRAFEELYKNEKHLFENLNDEKVELCRKDVYYHTSFLIQAINLDSKPLFEDYTKWVFELFKSLGISFESYVISLNYILSVINDTFGEGIAKVARKFLNDSIEFYKNEEKVIQNSNPLQDYKEQYKKLLLQGDRRSASKLIDELISKGVGVKEIYTYIFRESLYDIGLLWQTGKINVAQEHFFTAATQMIMTQLYPYIFTHLKNGHTIVGACASGELHEIGIRMVCDLLEMDGYNTHFLGASTPAQGVADYAYFKKAEAILLSVTLSINLESLRKTIEVLRADDRLKGLKIIVGGRPFTLDPELYAKVGADYSTTNVEELKRIIEQ
ncbi:MAG: cobalamin-dependent protein [Fervidobacterium sp.]|uniref:Methanogenic corrinoid protein MtbC1 n=1 Tax=Fervidobacterium gondwanense DSM 13020 TaxID=1121883 RepID=A0A1M7SC12_FERGO|nr:cobalamin-dependent protein [Fervidobacterium gondwanense]SHN55944.1 Methanogenic corrinoid protein MtbC1 [Fervidobacterium gondwanense DSM 13020]